VGHLVIFLNIYFLFFNLKLRVNLFIYFFKSLWYKRYYFTFNVLNLTDGFKLTAIKSSGVHI
jgi:hypothetical protein